MKKEEVTDVDRNFWRVCRSRVWRVRPCIAGLLSHFSPRCTGESQFEISRNARRVVGGVAGSDQ